MSWELTDEIAETLLAMALHDAAMAGHLSRVREAHRAGSQDDLNLALRDLVVTSGVRNAYRQAAVLGLPDFESSDQESDAFLWESPTIGNSALTILLRDPR